MDYRVRMRRGGLFVALGSAVLGALAMAPGCGGDDSNTTTVTDDGSTPSDSGSTSQTDSPAGGAIEVIASDLQVYVGQEAHLDASQSKRPTGAVLTFSWTVKDVPAGSKITTSSLSGANTETPKFTNDVAGDYILTAKASVGDQSASKDVVVHALNAPVFYIRVNSKDVPPTITYNAVGADGTGEHALSCKEQVLPDEFSSVFADAGNAIDAATSDGGVTSTFGPYIMQMALSAFLGSLSDQAMDSYEMSAGTPSRAAFGQITLPSDGGTKQVSLVIATTANSCQNPPTKVHQIGQITGQNPMVMQPRFSPDGSRVAFLEERGEQDSGQSQDVHVEVVGYDGTSFRELAPYCPTTKECWGENLFPRRPQWLDPTHLAWMRVVDAVNNTQPPYSWEIVFANDAPGATVSRYMTCSSYQVPYSFAFLADGQVLANFKPSKEAPEDLVVLGRDSGGACTFVRNLTKLPLANKNSYARDFAVSPDGSLVAYLHHLNVATDASTDPQAPPQQCFSQDSGTFTTTTCQNFGFTAISSVGGKLYAVPVDGTSPPHPIGGKELDAMYGPRFISAGTRLAWNGVAPFPAGFDAGILDAGGATDGGFNFGALPLGAGFNAMNVVPVQGGDVVSVAVADFNNGDFPLGGGNGGACECRPECIGTCTQTCQANQCQGSQCTTANKRGGAELGIGVGGLIGLAFLGRRRSRPRRRSK